MHSNIIIDTHTQISLTFNDSKYLRNPNKPNHNRKTPIPSKILTSSISGKEIVSFNNHKQFVQRSHYLA